MSGRYKSAMTEWREELIKAAQIGDVDGTTFRALAAVTLGFRADGTGFSTNDALGDQNDWSPRAVTFNIARCLDSGWLIRKNEPSRGKSSDYECAYPWEKRGINGGYPAGKRIATKREAGKRVQSVATYGRGKVATERHKGSNSTPHRSQPVAIPSHQDDKGETLKASPSRPKGRPGDTMASPETAEDRRTRHLTVKCPKLHCNGDVGAECTFNSKTRDETHIERLQMVGLARGDGYLANAVRHDEPQCPNCGEGVRARGLCEDCERLAEGIQNARNVRGSWTERARMATIHNLRTGKLSEGPWSDWTLCEWFTNDDRPVVACAHPAGDEEGYCEAHQSVEEPCTKQCGETVLRRRLADPPWHQHNCTGQPF